MSNEHYGDEDVKSFKRFCQTCVLLCQHDIWIRSRIVGSLQFALSSQDLPRCFFKPIIQTLSAVHISEDDGSFVGIVEELLTGNLNLSDDDFISLATLYFQTLMITEKVSKSDISSLMANRSLWTSYQVARQAIRYGHYSICKLLCDRVTQSSSSELVSFWMRSLSKVASAEEGLSKSRHAVSLDKSISRAIALYVEALSSLKSVASFGYPLSFQTKYLELRLQSLQCLESLRQACKLVKTSPAPAIAAAVAMSARDDLLKYGSIVTQMRKSAKDFRVLADNYFILFQSSFNADDQTLSHLQLIQNSNTMIAEAVESLFQTNRMSSLIVDQNTNMEISSQETRGPSIEHMKLIKVCHSISSTVANELTNRNTVKIESRHIQILEEMTEKLLSLPLSIPRLFFQSVQNTSLKLALSPQPKATGELVIVFYSNHFVLKAEGVVITSGKRDTRKVWKVMLNVSTSSVTASVKADSLGSKHHEVNLSSIVIPRNDYFQSQFLIKFPTPGLHSVAVEASIIDENEAQWKTGPVVNTTIKVVDDGKS
jgi:integrator complex subunit 7